MSLVSSCDQEGLVILLPIVYTLHFTEECVQKSNCTGDKTTLIWGRELGSVLEAAVSD